MKNYLLIIIVFSITTSCNGPQKSTLAGNNSSLTGTWELKSAATNDLKFEDLFADKVPLLILNSTDSTVSGNSSCNSFNGKFVSLNGNISFSKNMAMTRMFCEGDGERVFMELLSKVDSYSISSDTILQLKTKETLQLEFVKK